MDLHELQQTPAKYLDSADQRLLRLYRKRNQKHNIKADIIRQMSDSEDSHDRPTLRNSFSSEHKDRFKSSTLDEELDKIDANII